MNRYQLCFQRNGQGDTIDTTWPPRDYKSASALYHYHQRNWPENTYWLKIVD